MPAEAGIQGLMLRTLPWTPACAGVTIPENIAATMLTDLDQVALVPYELSVCNL